VSSIICSSNSSVKKSTKKVTNCCRENKRNTKESSVSEVGSSHGLVLRIHDLHGASPGFKLLVIGIFLREDWINVLKY